MKSPPLLRFKSKVIFTSMLIVRGTVADILLRGGHISGFVAGESREPAILLPSFKGMLHFGNQLHSGGQMAVAAAEARRTSALCLDKVVTWLLRGLLPGYYGRGCPILMQEVFS